MGLSTMSATPGPEKKELPVRQAKHITWSSNGGDWSVLNMRSYSRSNLVAESPNESIFTPYRSISDRYRLHIFLLSSLSLR